MAETLVFTITNLALGRLDQPASVLLTDSNLRQNSVKEGGKTSASLVRALNSGVATTDASFVHRQ